MFAAAAEQTGTSQVTLELGDCESPTVQQVARHLIREYPQLDLICKRSRWAMGTEFVELDLKLETHTDAISGRPAIELALIPPVSGG